MTRDRRRRLEARAYPDPIRYASVRRRVRVLLIVAAVLGVAHLYLGAAIAVLLAVPSAVAYVRRELAVGALVAAQHRPALPATPVEDLRSVYQRV